MTLDLSKLSPISRMKVARAMYDAINIEIRNMKDDLHFWEQDGSINSGAGKEMQAWKNALVELQGEVVKVM